MTKHLTHEILEELARKGEATVVADKILSREYVWKTDRYFCVFTDDPAQGGPGWVVTRTEPRVVYTPAPPTALTQIATIAAQQLESKPKSATAQHKSRLAAYAAIVDVLLREGLVRR